MRIELLGKRGLSRTEVASGPGFWKSASMVQWIASVSTTHSRNHWGDFSSEGVACSHGDRDSGGSPPKPPSDRAGAEVDA